MSQDMLIFVVAGIVFLALAGIGLVFMSGDNDKARKRAKDIGARTATTTSSRREDTVQAQRRRQTQQMLDKLKAEGAKKGGKKLDLDARIAQAGLSLSTSVFWMISAGLGLTFTLVCFIMGVDGFELFGVNLKSQVLWPIIAGLVGFFGFPRWVLGFLAAGRAKKMTSQFADAIDIIVRGVKSGLPLNECLRIIAHESPAPLGAEFEKLTDSIAMGTDFERALQTFYERVPLPEINFFCIVLTIQAKAGGNLSEALGNLSAVIRSRRMMREKVSALSSEAKSSAMIIGALPFVVGTLVFITTPAYIMLLFNTELGNLFLGIGAALMITGTTVMRKMINFDM